MEITSTWIVQFVGVRPLASVLPDDRHIVHGDMVRYFDDFGEINQLYILRDVWPEVEFLYSLNSGNLIKLCIHADNSISVAPVEP